MEVSRSRCLLDVPAVAQLLGLSEKAVRNLVFRRQVPFRKHGNRVVFLEEELQAFLGMLPGCTVEEAQQRVTRPRGRDHDG
jgi:predicted DNA-binding transcriptional regulator AlpA